MKEIVHVEQIHIDHLSKRKFVLVVVFSLLCIRKTVFMDILVHCKFSFEHWINYTEKFNWNSLIFFYQNSNLNFQTRKYLFSFTKYVFSNQYLYFLYDFSSICLHLHSSNFLTQKVENYKSFHAFFSLFEHLQKPLKYGRTYSK